jgi:hypothetical protein
MKDGFEDVLGPVPNAQQKPAQDGFEDVLGPIPAQPEGRFIQSMLNGLTFGARPRIAAAMEAGGSFSGPEYDAALKQEWAKDDAYAKANPGKAFAGEVVGSIPTMFVPGLGAARVAQAAARTGQAASNLSRGGQVARALGVGKEVGTVGSEAGKLGAKTAALTGGISSRDEDLSGKLADAAKMAPFGYAAGRGGQYLGSKIASGAEHITDALKYGGDAKLGAINAMQQGLRRDRISPDQLRQAVLPNLGKAHVTDEGRELILTAYGQAIESGATDAAARTAARNAYRQMAQVQPKTADAHVKAALDQHLEANTVPLAIDELATLAGSRGQNLHWTRRAAMNVPGEGREDVAQAVMGRQERILPQLREQVVDSIGTPDFEGQLASVIERNKMNAFGAYTNAFLNEQPFDLSQVFARARHSANMSGGKIRNELSAAVDDMEGALNRVQGPDLTRLKAYINVRSELGDAIDASKNQFGQATSLTRALTGFKADMDQVVRKANPEWWKANLATADGKGVENAMRKGAEMTLTPSSRTRQTLAWLRTASDDEKEAFKIGFARTLHTELSRLGDTHDVSKVFLKGGKDGVDGVKAIMREVLGDEVAGRIMQTITRAKAATRTFNAYGNSQTEPLRQAINDQNVMSKIAGFAQMLNPRAALEAIGESIGSRINEKRNAELLKLYSKTTDKPHEFLDLLRKLETLRAQRNPVFQNRLNVDAYSIGAPAGSGAMSAFGRKEEAEQYRPKPLQVDVWKERK